MSTQIGINKYLKIIKVDRITKEEAQSRGKQRSLTCPTPLLTSPLLLSISLPGEALASH